MVSIYIGDDPNRGYTFDMNFDTRHPMDMLDIVHGCVEGKSGLVVFERKAISLDFTFTFLLQKDYPAYHRLHSCMGTNILAMFLPLYHPKLQLSI